MKQERASTILFTDDLSRIRLRPAFLLRFAQRLLFSSLLRSLRAEKGDLIVSGEGQAPAVARAGYRFRAYGSVLIQGISQASAQDLMPLLDEIFVHLEANSRFRTARGTSTAKVLVFRHFVVSFVELLLNANAIAHFLRVERPRSVTVSNARSTMEELARGVASDLGIPVREARAGWLLRLSTRLKNQLSLRRRPFGKVEQVEAQWASSLSAPTAPGKKFDAVIFCEEERRLNRCLELAEHFRELGKTVVIVGLPFREEAKRRLQELKQQKVEIALLPHFLSAAERVEIGAQARADAEASWHALESSPRVRDFLFRGIALWRLFGPKLGLGWDSLNLSAAYGVAAAENCLAAFDPRHVVVADSGLYAKAFVEVARAQGRRSLWYVDNPNLCTIRFWSELLPRYFEPDAAIATSPLIQTSLTERFGYPASRVFRLLPRPSAPAPAPPPSLAIRQGRPVVLALSSYVTPDISAETRRRFHVLVAQAAAAAGYDLLVRAHPNEALEPLRRDLATWGIQPIFCSQKENIQQILRECDLACIIFSQAGLEVLRGEKPLFVLQERNVTNAYEDIIPYAGSEAAVYADLGAERPQELAHKFRECVENPVIRIERLRRGRELFRVYSTSEFDPDELARFGTYLGSK